ncbi:MAG: DNA polymerase I, partial [Anaerolineae bacterium]
KRLATIRTDAPVALGLEECRTSEYDPEEVLRLMRELEFRSLAERLPALSRDGAGPESGAPAEAEDGFSSHVVANRKELDRLIGALSKADHLTLDVETTSTDPMAAELVGIALAVGQEDGYYVPVGHVGVRSEHQMPLDEVLDRLRPILEDSSVPKWAHNAIYDLGVLSRHGVSVRGLAFDTMIAAFLVDPSGRGYGLKDLAWKRLGADVTPISELIGTGRGEITMAQVPIDQAAPYAAADVVFTDRLALEFAGELKEKALWDLFVDVEIPLVQVLLEMELAGVAVDTAYLSELSREMHLRLSEVEEGIHDVVGHPFNVASSPQLQTVLFEELGLPPQKRTKTGYSTSADVLETLRPLHPIIALIEEHRSISKLKSTYVDALPLMVNGRTGRIHTSYHQTGAVTGRISSSGPNLQNIPVRTDPGRQVRKAFVAPAGSRLLAGDYSQVELRILAHVSQDAGLLEAFARGEDVHASTAASLYEVGLDAVTADMRRVAKTINFGLIYGMGEYGLAQRTGLSREQAGEFIASYFARFPKVKTYIDETVRMAKDEGYVSTVLGHRRYFPELRSGVSVHRGIRRAAERMAINMPIQGSAADIIKLATIRLHASLASEELEARLILQVHDELVLEVPEREVETAAALVREVMEGAYALEPALAVELSAGENWGEMAPLPA